MSTYAICQLGTLPVFRIEETYTNWRGKTKQRWLKVCNGFDNRLFETRSHAEAMSTLWHFEAQERENILRANGMWKPTLPTKETA